MDSDIGRRTFAAAQQPSTFNGLGRGRLRKNNEKVDSRNSGKVQVLEEGRFERLQHRPRRHQLDLQRPKADAQSQL